MVEWKAEKGMEERQTSRRNGRGGGQGDKGKERVIRMDGGRGERNMK
jgi:hypothetical protein